MDVDHILIACRDLEAYALRLADEHGLEGYEGGRHPGWGTANWVVPLGGSYLELVTVVDEAEARASGVGRWITRAAEGAFVGWAVRADDVDATAARLGLEIEHGQRTRPNGATLEWRMSGLEEASEHSWRPFFIEWADPAAFPGATAEPGLELVRLDVECDPGDLAAWLGPHSLPLDVAHGDAGVSAVHLRGPTGPITLGRARAA